MCFNLKIRIGEGDKDIPETDEGGLGPVAEAGGFAGTFSLDGVRSCSFRFLKQTWRQIS